MHTNSIINSMFTDISIKGSDSLRVDNGFIKNSAVNHLSIYCNNSEKSNSPLIIGCDHLESLYLPEIKTLRCQLVDNESGLNILKLDIPSLSSTEVNEAFSNCHNIRKISIPNITSIAANTFYNC